MNKAQIKGNITKVAMYHAGAIAEENVAITMKQENGEEVKFYWKNSAQVSSRQGTYGYNIIRSLLTATELNSLHEAAKLYSLDARATLRVWANNSTLDRVLKDREVMIGEKAATRKDGSPIKDQKGNQRVDYTPYPVAYQMEDKAFIDLIKAQVEESADEDAANF